VIGGFAQWDGLNFPPPYQFLIHTAGARPPVTMCCREPIQRTDYAAFGQFQPETFLLALQAQFGGARYSSVKTTNNVAIIPIWLAPE